MHLKLNFIILCFIVTSGYAQDSLKNKKTETPINNKLKSVPVTSAKEDNRETDDDDDFPCADSNAMFWAKTVGEDDWYCLCKEDEGYYNADGEYLPNNPNPNCEKEGGIAPPLGPPGNEGGVTIPPGAGGNYGNPPNINAPPTVDECYEALTKCNEEASKDVDLCIKSNRIFIGNELIKGRPCYGQSLEELLDGFYYNTFGRGGEVPCKPRNLFDDDPLYDNCRKQYLIRSWTRCLLGVPSNSISNTESLEHTFSVEFGLASWSPANKKSTSNIQVSTQEHLGIQFSCQKKGKAFSDACKDMATKCISEAKEHATKLLVATDQTPSNYLSSIDKTILGFESSNGKAIDIKSIPYKNLSRIGDESPEQYLSRLKFLSEWSNFLKQNNFSKQQIQNLNLVLKRAQTSYEYAFKEYSTATIIWNTELTMRKWSKSYEQEDVPEPILRLDLSQILHSVMAVFILEIGSPQTANFLKNVWPGADGFGLIAPMSASLVLTK